MVPRSASVRAASASPRIAAIPASWANASSSSWTVCAIRPLAKYVAASPGSSRRRSHSDTAARCAIRKGTLSATSQL